MTLPLARRARSYTTAVAAGLFAAFAHAAPGDILFSDTFETNLAQWTIDNSGGGIAAITSQTASSGASSLALNGNTVRISSTTINANVPEAELSIWVRRGDDSFSENPETNEDLIVQYLTSGGSWVNLETFGGGGTAGEISSRTYTLPNDALHSALQIRFTLTQGSGSAFDFWHIDDVVVTETGLPSGPVAEWRFDELSWDGSAGEILDNSGNGYNGSAVNSTPTSGFLCNAADLSATGTADYLSLNAAALDGLGDFTLSAWVTSSRTGIQTIVSAAQSASELNEATFMFNSNTEFWPQLRQTPFDNSTLLATSQDIADGGWHHVVWVRTRSTSQTCLYIDGASQGCVTHPNGANFLDVVSSGLIIGQEQDSIAGGFDATQAWDGLVDELLVFNSALTSSSVTTIYNNQLAGNNYDGTARICPTPLPAPVAEWQMEQSGWTGSAGEVTDSSGNGLNLTAFNGALNSNSGPAISGDPGTCYYGDFNGSNQYLAIADNSLLDISDNLSITAWINPRSLPGSGLMSILSKDENYEFHLTPAGEIFWWWGGGAQELTTSGANISPNNWYHIAITFESGAQVIYVNGVALGSNNWNGSLTLNSDPLQIGQDQNFAGRYFNGAIDEVQIYNATLTESHVNEIMAQTHPCSATSICTVIHSDDFATVSYSGGTPDWSSNWIETNDNNSAASGAVAVVNNALRIRNSSNVSVTRELDLSAALSASFSVDISSANLDGNDRFQIIVSNNGGASYSVLEQVQNDLNASRTYDISAFVGPNTRIGFRSIQGFNQSNEYVAFDNVAVTITEPCDNNVLVLTHDGSAINCYREAVSIRVENASGVLQTSYTGTITLSTSGGNGFWDTVDDNGTSSDSANGTLSNSGLNNGVATYNFTAADAGTVTLYLRNTVAESVNIGATDGSASDDDSEGLLTFRPFGFIVSPAPVPTQIAGRPFDLTVTAAGQTPQDASCGVIEEYTGTQAISFWSNFSQPTSSPTAITVDNVAIANSSASASSQSVMFNQGVATITVQYNDVGTIGLNVRDDVGIGDPVTGTTDEIIGGLTPFVVRPFGYHLSISGEPNATDASGNVYAIAGDTFSTSVSSVVWQAADDLDNDGVPDDFSQLGDNATTPNIQNISASGSDIGLVPTAQLVANSNGLLGDATLSFNEFDASGVAQLPQSWSEAGILTIDLATANFQNGGEGVLGQRQNIGRFIPQRFALTLADDFEAVCDSTFTYAGINSASGLVSSAQLDAMTLQIQALNSLGNPTRNYDGVFERLGPGDISVSPIDNATATTATGTLNRDAINTVDFDNFGFADNLVIANIGYQFPTYLAPFELYLAVVASDQDGVTGSLNSATVLQRLGRAYVQTSYGPETESLEIPTGVEYFDGTQWTRNLLDNCSSYRNAQVTFISGSYQGDLDSGETQVLLPSTVTTVVSGQSANGAGFWLAAPGIGNSGEVNLSFDLSTQPWLQFDWDGDASLDNPSATAGFGRYRGSDRVIYWRER